MDGEFTKYYWTLMLILPFMLKGMIVIVTVWVNHGINIDIIMLQDEKKVYQLICVVGETRQGDDKDSNLYRIYLQRIEHLHYKVSNQWLQNSNTEHDSGG